MRHLGPELAERCLKGPGARYKDRVEATHLRRPQPAVRLAQPPPGAVSADGTPNLPAHREACAGSSAAWHPQEHKGPPLLSPALLEDCLDLVGVPEAGIPGKPECPDASTHNRTARR